MAHSSYNFFDHLLRIPDNLTDDKWEMTYAISPLYAHELTHFFQIVATAGGWYLFRLTEVINRVSVDLLMGQYPDFHNKVIKIPILYSDQNDSNITLIKKIDQEIKLLLNPFTAHLIDELKCCTTKCYQSNTDIIRAAENGKLLNIANDYQSFLFGPDNLKIPVGLSLVLETLATSVEYNLSNKPMDKDINKINGVYHFNQHSLKPKENWANISNAEYNLPLLYCLKFANSTKKSRMASKDISQFLSMPFYIHKILFHISYLSIMLCIKTYPKHNITSNKEIIGTLKANPGQIFLACLSEIDIVLELFMTPRQEVGNTGQDLLGFYEYLIKNLPSLKKLGLEKYDFESSCNDFLNELNISKKAKYESKYDNLECEYAEAGEKIFEKFWQSTYREAFYGGGYPSCRSYGNILIQSIIETNNTPPVLLKNGIVGASVEKYTQFLSRHLIYKILFTDNIACWQESNSDIPIYSWCPQKNRDECLIKYECRTDVLRSFCTNDEYLEMMNSTYPNEKRIKSN